MALYRSGLPTTNGDILLADGGIETTLMFHEGFELPCFACFVLLERAEGRAALRRYFEPFTDLAREYGVGLMLDTPTWRANRDWGREIGYSEASLADVNRTSADLLLELRSELPEGAPPLVISASLGPRSDGYKPTACMRADEAEAYHSVQIGQLAATEADLITAYTLPYVEEAIGIARAARSEGMPLAVSFTVETDGKLPTGQPLGEAIQCVDEATGAWPTHYMVNCAHTTHIAESFESAPWIERIGGVRANASKLSHAELDEAEELDEGNPEELATEMADLRAKLPELRVIGGCCGTDQRHVAAMARAVLGS